MNITTDELFTGDGILREEYMFVKRYGLAPSVYACPLDSDDEKFDFSNIDKKLILSIFPDAKIFMVSGRHVNDEVSCATSDEVSCTISDEVSCTISDEVSFVTSDEVSSDRPSEALFSDTGGGRSISRCR